jgi:uncharacterized LabA/DUF88 family protein
MTASSSRIALYIDGANLHATARTLGFDIDYKRLLKEFQSRGDLVRAYYYTAVIEDQEFVTLRPLIDWLDYNGYTVVTKATKEFIDASGRRKVKGNMDIELAVDAMELADHVDQIVLFSGDGDFRSLVEAVQRRGVRVTVVSTISSQPPMIADELRRQADVFTDLVDLQSKLVRDPSERAARARQVNMPRNTFSGGPRREAATRQGKLDRVNDPPSWAAGAPSPESPGDRTNGILPFQSAGAVQVKEQKSCTNTFWRSPCCVSRLRPAPSRIRAPIRSSRHARRMASASAAS